ncbi:MAG: TAXI family TRAP transporter solute-binding subunit [Deltaproteobacteria bacterium]|nr:TAXI family TRAP transporter solute-binding subunit [Deltaproteobacteria bacterium]
MTLRIGTSELGGTFYTQGSAIAELFNHGRPAEERCVVLPSVAASIDNANRLDRGEVEFGFMASNWIGRAKNGTSPFTRKIELRMVSPVNAGPLFFVTLAGSSIKTISDLIGKRLAVGVQGSGMVGHVLTIFAAIEIPWNSFTPVYLSFADGAEALIGGDIDAQFQPPIPNQVMTNLSERADVRVVAYGPRQIQSILAQVGFYRAITIKKGAFRGVVEDVPQIAVVNVMVTHERLPDKPVHDIVKTILENLETLPKMNPLFKGVRELFEPLRSKGAATFEMGGVPLHPGALQAYREAGWLS